MQSQRQRRPCAGCKTLRRKCSVDCIFASDFPPDEAGMENFKAIHTVYGATNVVKILKEIEPSQRATAVESLAYEAKCRLKDNTYGCVGILAILQNQLKQVLQSLESAKKELATYNRPLNDQQLALLQKQDSENFMAMRGNPGIVIREQQQISMGKELAHVDAAGEQQILPRPDRLQSEWLQELLLQQALQKNIGINQMPVASQPTSTLGGEYETQPPQEHLQCQPFQLQQQNPSLSRQDLTTQLFWQQHTQRESADDLMHQCAQPAPPQSQQHMQTQGIGPSQQSITVDMLHQFTRQQALQSRHHMQAEGSGLSKQSVTVDQPQKFNDHGKGILMEADDEDKDDLFTTINLNHMPEAAGFAVESFVIPACSSSRSHSHSQLLQTQAPNSQQNAQKEPIDHGAAILVELDDEQDQQL